MRVLTVLGLSVTFALSLGIAGPRAAACEAVGEIQFICGLVSLGDLAVVRSRIGLCFG